MSTTKMTCPSLAAAAAAASIPSKGNIINNSNSSSGLTASHGPTTMVMAADRGVAGGSVRGLKGEGEGLAV